MTIRNRKWRRNHTQRVKHRIRKILRVHWNTEEYTFDDDSRYVGILASTGMRPCSCLSCRNPMPRISRGAAKRQAILDQEE